MNKKYRRRALRAAAQLNEGAWRYAVATATKAQLRRFQKHPERALATYRPCPKARVLIDAAGACGSHFGTAIQEAAVTECPCHPRTTWRHLLDMAFKGEE